MSSKVKNKSNKLNKNKKFSPILVMQNIGKSLVFPIAVLPAAALLLRIGAFIGSYGQVNGNLEQEIFYWIGHIMETPGSIVFNNLPLIFGIGVAFGFAKENRGEVALVGAISYFALIGLAQTEGGISTLFYQSINLGNGVTIDGKYYSDVLYLNIEGGNSTWLMNFGVFGGILTGLTTSLIYNKFYDIRLHPALGFFSGRRFVPIVALFIMILVSIAMAAIWPWINIALIKLSYIISKVPWLGAGVYGFANRLLIPFGLHQILNTYFWFQSPILTDSGNLLMHYVPENEIFEPILGDISAFSLITNGGIFEWTSNGELVQGIIKSSGLGDNFQLYEYDISTGDIGSLIPNGVDIIRGTNIGMYQSGFFPTMMFGLPAIAIAMSMRSESEHKKSVWTFMIAGSIVTFLTGITEPLEFSFMFISPIIYVIYSFLTGVYASITVVLGISVGFGFSAGLIDWILSILSGGVGIISKDGSFANLELIGIGILSSIINFTIIYFLISILNISTLGRNGNVIGLTNIENKKNSSKKNNLILRKEMAKKTIEFIGRENIEKIDNCITRVRLTVKDNSKYLDEDAIKIGYIKVIKVGKKTYQMVIGPDSEIIANEMKRIMYKENIS